ncbi:glycosyltransferase [Halotalea alkalilenta]|uniref:glycosyltransferase n=1 Tax=Halotalea alkalilenta TaxID=376489 RepID=UPI0009E084D2|nr:glycosyltransferase [Halotalea alkalilenta]
MKIHVSIVDYFKGRRVEKTLDALLAQRIDGRLIATVIDNSCSNDNFFVLSKKISALRNVTLLRSHSNLGYTRGTNLSVDASADYIVLLNPDVILEDPNTLARCVDLIASDESVGIVGIAQCDDEGKREQVARRFPNLKVQIARRMGNLGQHLMGDDIRSYEYSEHLNDDGGFHVVDWVQSSFWVVRGELWRKLNGLDEYFYLFMSEADFSRRAAMLGYKTILYNDLMARSDGIRASGGGVKALFTSKALRIHVLDALKYYFRSR